jgi:hypothetical protein
MIGYSRILMSGRISWLHIVFYSGLSTSTDVLFKGFCECGMSHVLGKEVAPGNRASSCSLALLCQCLVTAVSDVPESKAGRIISAPHQSRYKSSIGSKIRRK